MDNRIFSVNGRTKGMLTETIRLALWQDGGMYNNDTPSKLTAKGYVVSDEHGLIFLNWMNNSNKEQLFLVPHTAEMLGELAYTWLNSDQAKLCLSYLGDWEKDMDHDGSNELGWCVYCQDWGHVGEFDNAIVAIRPSYLWYGK